MTLNTETKGEGKNKKERIYNYSRNRELSWLGFNQRVLREALDENNPSYEKLKFISIFNSNLDEFYNVRVGSLNDLTLLKNPPEDNKTGMTPQEQLDLIYEKTRKLLKENEELYYRVMGELKQYGIQSYTYDELDGEQKEFISNIYDDHIKPILAPQIIDFFHPFPFIENKNIYIICELSYKDKYSLGLLPIPDSLPSFYMLGDKKWIRTERILKEKVQDIFSNYTVKKTYVMNLHRNMDINYEEHLEDQVDDYRMQMKKLLKKRTRLQVVRVNTDSPLDHQTKEFLKEHLNIKDYQFFTYTSPFNMGNVFGLESMLKTKCDPTIFYNAFSPKVGEMIESDKSLFQQIEEKDRLLIYPYEDIDSFLKLLEEAAENPDVISIKITIYRLAKNSRVVKNLVKARENGKDVTVMLELRARFDEESNINYSQILYNEGCTILYGTEDYKVHSKVCLITYKDQEGNIKYISQIGTGNYNESTSKQYSDISLMTAHQGIGKDCYNFFNHINLENVNNNYSHILAAPYSLKVTIIEKIEKEIAKGENGKIFFKYNSLTDKDIMMKLEEASRNKVQVRMIIRGISCLRPGVEGFTDNIEIRSIVGRYLEHPRVLIFGDNEEVFIGSSDLMTRNLVRRVEVMVPIYDEFIKKKIIEYMDIQWKDNTKARIMNSSGIYEPVPVEPGDELVNSQETMMRLAIERELKPVPFTVTPKEESKKEEEKLSFFDRIKRFFGIK
ncbi:polyphosphate kinase 1 [Lagierella sp.]|uniref:polyphosphate kinase 1 n=1 Tax=Lagierella sp. TaxID=2849657 RepID=UPI0026130C6A|nr:polyphosphate kinase 1 [Lagierella sp.]